jgi:hypothetical protein
MIRARLLYLPTRLRAEGRAFTGVHGVRAYTEPVATKHFESDVDLGYEISQPPRKIGAAAFFLDAINVFWASSLKVHENARIKSQRPYPETFVHSCAVIESGFARLYANEASGNLSGRDIYGLVTLVLANSGPATLNFTGSFSRLWLDENKPP